MRMSAFSFRSEFLIFSVLSPWLLSAMRGSFYDFCNKIFFNIRHGGLNANPSLRSSLSTGV